MKHLRNALIVIWLAAYAAAFYATPLTSVRNDAGQPLLRVQLLWQLLWLPDELLLSNWFGAPPEFSLFDRLPVLLVAGLILAWAAVLGWLLMVLCRANRGLGRLELAVFAIAVGLNAVSTWVLLAGLAGALSRTWTFIVPALLTLAVAGYVKRRKIILPAGKIDTFSDRQNVGQRRHACSQAIAVPATAKGAISSCGQHFLFSPHWLWLAVPFLLAILLAGMLPPLDFDVREYHLQAPKEFYRQGRIEFLPHNVYANMALGTEMLSLLAMVIAGDWWLGALAGKTAIAAFTPLTALALLAAGRRLFGPAAGVVAALVYISVPWIVSISAGGLVEGGVACYLFLAVYALLLRGGPGTAVQLPSQQPRTAGTAVELPSQQMASSTHPASLLVLAGYLAGAAVATKYPAVLFVLLPLAGWVALDRLRGRGSKSVATGPRPVGSDPPSAFRLPPSAAALGVFLLAAAVGCGLWFGKNWVQSGNPAYPLLYEVFDGKTWTAEKERQWSRVHRPHDFSAKAIGTDLARVVLTSEWLSPLIVPLAALAFVAGGRRRDVRWALLAYVGFVIAVWWLFSHRIDRFWLPVLPVLALLAGAGAGWSAERWWRWLFAGLLLVGLGANFLVASMGTGNAWFVGLERLRRQPGWIDPWHAYFNSRAIDGRLLCVGDAAVFDLTPPVLYNTCFDDCIFEKLVRGKTAAQVRAELAARQIAYIYVNWAEIARYRRTYGFTDFVQPAVFDWLVAEGVLEPLPVIEGHAGRGWRKR